ncbi:TlpA family protein disulfide reductase [Porphyromonas macacae]|uniref:TlpA family protein disulfide reductase n=1 Tax=Porphyromonas macacae TaxID=28115 RepID=UPI0024AD104C|nr:TlpA disulfide reductase family protein [Porphyromonas macacae]
MKRIITFTLAVLSLLACKTEKKQENTATSTVHIKGRFIGIGKDFVRMNYNGAAAVLGESRDIILKIDSAGNVDTTFVLTEPAYYNISRNTLYLTPGDDLTMKITPLNTEAEFEGRGAEANIYMKERLFPKGGSFLKGGKNVKSEFSSTMMFVDSLAEVRMGELTALTAVSDEFKQQEAARIKADVINSYMHYANYSNFFNDVKNKEEMQAKREEYATSITAYITPKLQEILDEKFLDVAVVRDVISRHQDSMLNEKWFKGITLPTRTQELFACATIIGKLREGVSEEVINEAKNHLQTIQNKDFAAEIEEKIAQNSKLLPGQPAIDLEITDVAGNVKKLSDFKGKYIYIDLWATWCSPCLQEAPAFEKLSRQYAGKDIVFIPISTDTTREPWLAFLTEHKKELTQYHSTDLALKNDWMLLGIPRFILIDKDFNIIDAFAPRPSEEKIITLIDGLLPKQA